MDWSPITSQEDFLEMQNQCAGFHDSCLASATYHSGAYVSKKNGAMLPINCDSKLVLKYHQQWDGLREIEVMFEGLRLIFIGPTEWPQGAEVGDVTFEVCKDCYTWKVGCSNEDRKFLPHSAVTEVQASKISWRFCDSEEI